MKKLLSIAICALMLISTTACNTDGKTNGDINSNISSVESSTANNTSSETPDNNTSITESEVQPVNGTVDGFFDDAVFIGDSVTLKLNLFADKVRNNIGLECLDDAKFLCSGSLSFTNAMWDLDDPNSVHPSYQGIKYLLPEGVQAVGAKKIFIMLGMNDFAAYGVDTAIENAKTVISSILALSPDAQIYIQSVTPIIAKAQAGDFNNQNIEALNVELKKLAEENSWKYLDVASVLKDENGCLVDRYCSDPDAQGIHFTDEACELWIEYLENNA